MGAGASAANGTGAGPPPDSDGLFGSIRRAESVHEAREILCSEAERMKRTKSGLDRHILELERLKRMLGPDHLDNMVWLDDHIDQLRGHQGRRPRRTSAEKVHVFSSIDEEEDEDSSKASTPALSTPVPMRRDTPQVPSTSSPAGSGSGAAEEPDAWCRPHRPRIAGK